MNLKDVYLWKEDYSAFLHDLIKYMKKCQFNHKHKYTCTHIKTTFNKLLTNRSSLYDASELLLLNFVIMLVELVFGKVLLHSFKILLSLSMSYFLKYFLIFAKAFFFF